MTQRHPHDWNRQIIEEFRAHGGHVNGPFEGTPLLLLTTTGAKSGQRRTNPLVYLAESGRLFVFATKSGAPTNPDWYANLRAHPRVSVELGTQRFEAAAVVVQGEERDRIYATQAQRIPGFADYARKTTRQIPVIELVRRSGDITLLNHVGLLVSDVNAAVARYEQLGFLFAPLSLVKTAFTPGAEPEAIGVGKRDAIFQHNFLEIAGITDHTIWDRLTKAQRGYFDIEGALSRYQGLHILYLGTDDLEAVRERLIQEGLPSSEIGRLQRKVETPEGERTLRAQMLHAPQVSIAHHENPEVLLQPRYMRHPNRATMVTEGLVCSTDPATLAGTYARYAGHTSQQHDHLSIVNLGSSRVIVVAPEHLGEVIPGSVPLAPPFLAGFTVATADLDAARAVLTENAVPFQEYGQRLMVRPQDAWGSAVLFEEEGTTRP